MGFGDAPLWAVLAPDLDCRWVGMSADMGQTACALPPRGRPLVEAGAKASVSVVDPVCLFFSYGIARRVRM